MMIFESKPSRLTDGTPLARRPQISRHFPPSIRDALVAAADVPNTDSDPCARLNAIDNAVAVARRQRPDLFVQEDQ